MMALGRAAFGRELGSDEVVKGCQPTAMGSVLPKETPERPLPAQAQRHGHVRLSSEQEAVCSGKESPPQKWNWLAP